jgi:hypothetical protein
MLRDEEHGCGNLRFGKLDHVLFACDPGHVMNFSEPEFP